MKEKNVYTNGIAVPVVYRVKKIHFLGTQLVSRT